MAAKSEYARENSNFERKSGHSELVLPVSRVRTIMKSSPDVENISQEALYAVTVATEMFIKELSQKVLESKSEGLNQISYSDLAEFVNSQEHYRGFLDEIIPLKVLGRDILSGRSKENSEPGESEPGESEEESKQNGDE